MLFFRGAGFRGYKRLQAGSGVGWLTRGWRCSHGLCRAATDCQWCSMLWLETGSFHLWQLSRFQPLHTVWSYCWLQFPFAGVHDVQQDEWAHYQQMPGSFCCRWWFYKLCQCCRTETALSCYTFLVSILLGCPWCIMLTGFWAALRCCATLIGAHWGPLVTFCTSWQVTSSRHKFFQMWHV